MIQPDQRVPQQHLSDIRVTGTMWVGISEEVCNSVRDPDEASRLLCCRVTSQVGIRHPDCQESQKYEIPAMLRSGGGVIINTSSIVGHVGMPGAGVYIASKHAVEGITRATALEFAGQNIRVNAVAPGAVATDMIDRFAGEPGTEGRQQLAESHPMGRLGEVTEIAAAVLYLASDSASFTTGISLPVDGGYLAK